MARRKLNKERRHLANRLLLRIYLSKLIIDKYIQQYVTVRTTADTALSVMNK